MIHPIVIKKCLLKFFLAQSAGAAKYTDCISVEGLDPHTRGSCIWHKTIWWWGFSNAGDLGNAEYPSLPSLLGSFSPGVVALERVLSMSQIEVRHLNCVLMLNWIVWNRTAFTFNCVYRKNCLIKLNWIVWIRIAFTFNCIVYHFRQIFLGTSLYLYRAVVDKF